ncbi:hypothetical protein [Lyngbya sp. CCY1209]|uniref:hypothetical protein n=1 Tax=Lyngbya sp. CCY1209 TaxID=2886103 RepID=UPI002D2074DD|nr:hypothetical protein [Lyngbya sp. CCY1209]MEB3883245.1 hypothetical protein [Lyngbya sp. CCY1209]
MSTRLFNLESYVECRQYAHQFNKTPDALTPTPGDLPRGYKNLLKDYGDYRYLNQPILSENCPSGLTVNPTELTCMGTQLSTGSTPRLFIIPDTIDLLTLSTSHFLASQEAYLYGSAYHYWNNYYTIKDIQIDRHLLFLNLDNWVSREMIPIEIKNPTPILKHQTPIPYQLRLNPIETYQSICEEIASEILTAHFPGLANQSQTINHLANHLQKIAFFQKDIINQEQITLVGEIYHQGRIFYKNVTVSRDKIRGIILSKINLEEIKDLIQRYPNYQFVLVSQYHPFIESQVTSYLPGVIFVSSQRRDFDRIWRHKQNYGSRLPLFGIYLDKIEFKIAIEDQERWIQLTEGDIISREGESRELIGTIPELDNKDTFRIPKDNLNPTLPIRVNGEDFCKNGVPQDYSISVEEKQVTEDVEVRIKFTLTPGSSPILAVEDIENKYHITAELTDRIVKYYGYIPHAKLSQTRAEKSNKQIELFRYNSDRRQRLQDYLQKIVAELEMVNISKNRSPEQREKDQELTGLLSQITSILPKNSHRLDVLQYIDPEELTELTAVLSDSRWQKIPDILKLYPCHRSKINLVNSALMWVGKLYKFSPYILSDFYFNESKESNIIDDTRINAQYFQYLARTAINESLQQRYFNLFDNSEGFTNYGYMWYMWGYGRILLWYFNFQDSRHLFDYRHHFLTILEYLRKENPSSLQDQYKQNVFLSLSYLLGFREFDAGFCQPSSEEYYLAKEVIARFVSEPIKLNQVSREKSLNQLFEELIEEKSTEEDCDNLLQGS